MFQDPGQKNIRHERESRSGGGGVGEMASFLGVALFYFRSFISFRCFHKQVVNVKKSCDGIAPVARSDQRTNFDVITMENYLYALYALAAS